MTGRKPPPINATPQAINEALQRLIHVNGPITLQALADAYNKVSRISHAFEDLDTVAIGIIHSAAFLAMSGYVHSCLMSCVPEGSPDNDRIRGLLGSMTYHYAEAFRKQLAAQSVDVTDAVRGPRKPH